MSNNKVICELEKNDAILFQLISFVLSQQESNCTRHFYMSQGLINNLVVVRRFTFVYVKCRRNSISSVCAQ